MDYIIEVFMPSSIIHVKFLLSFNKKKASKKGMHISALILKLSYNI